MQREVFLRFIPGECIKINLVQINKYCKLNIIIKFNKDQVLNFFM